MFGKREKNPNSYPQGGGELCRIPILMPVIGLVFDTILIVLIPELLTQYYMLQRSCNYKQVSRFIHGSALSTTHHVRLLKLVRAVQLHLFFSEIHFFYKNNFIRTEILILEKKIKNKLRTSSMFAVAQNIRTKCLGLALLK